MGNADINLWARSQDTPNTLPVTLGILTTWAQGQRSSGSPALSPCPTGAHRRVGRGLLSMKYQGSGSCGADMAGLGGEGSVKHPENPGEASPSSGGGG